MQASFNIGKSKLCLQVPGEYRLFQVGKFVFGFLQNTEKQNNWGPG